MNGIRLAELDASDTLDVLHFFFEQETAFLSSEQATELTRIRTRIYDSLYEREYKYGKADTEARFKAANIGQAGRQYVTDEDLMDDSADEPLPEPFDPKKKPRKSYFDPTPLGPDADDPFNGLLDEPLHH